MANETRDGVMNQYINAVNRASKGRDVRSSIANGLAKAYNDADAHARQAADTIVTFDNKIKETNTNVEVLENERINPLSNRVDEAIRIIQEGEHTNVELEVMDGRTGYNGVIYPSIGTAVREQTHMSYNKIRGVEGRIDEIVNNQNSPKYKIPLATGQWVHKCSEVWHNYETNSPYGNSEQKINWTWTNNLDTTPNDGSIHYILVYKIAYTDADTTDNLRSIVLAPFKNALTESDVLRANTTLSDMVMIPKEGSGRSDIGNVAFVKRDIQLIIEDGGNSRIGFSDCIGVTMGSLFEYHDTTHDLHIRDYQEEGKWMDWYKDNNYLIPIALYAIIAENRMSIDVNKDDELVDLRVGADGVTYRTAGEAIRTCINNIVNGDTNELINEILGEV